MSALEAPYKGKVTFKVIPGASKASAEVQRFGVGNHGLVGLAADGTVKLKLPGHELGRRPDEAAVRQAIEQELKNKLLD